jgi:hypothetical protein
MWLRSVDKAMMYFTNRNQKIDSIKNGRVALNLLYTVATAVDRCKNEIIF